ncbi:SDR family oxidoreductase [Paraburkholderia saeva]|uniref:3-oxoacyl-[acyl-carrier-protein] reductase FabG n=1 Tax=Paraburkholderia saeva TaxID=2777537 RepID=A0A9N8RTP5_9BURK|nr:SDR family oxidoreductase [Paraburkholderia saeva]CAG4890137.1 3-oxoacyl-[acyl-carrier-protein] reductase FabG [Paraburkholderia saeva]CAG4893135.1 3-oxoacyl-[acyl-carrier-protein] reductase FabG [Paraburkholderia saeva]CAG4915131.1 3-oxoacyl-[acyl-carrier-protein] reductase FabG [Paraburkholderia saeva]
MSKIALVTGASRGIGASIAKRLARDGMTVVVNYSNRVEEADAVVAEIAAVGGKALAMKADVSSAKSVREMFDAIEAQLGKIDVLVNNAGIMPAVKPLAEHDDDTFDRVFAINLKGSFNTMREAATRLNDGGRIVNFSTSVIGLGFPGYAVYGATKAAIETMTNILAKEMRGRNITVNAVAPGPTATDLFLTGKSPETIDKLAKAAPLERLGTPDDIAAAVAFLAGPDGAWINGQTLRANGGIV